MVIVGDGTVLKQPDKSEYAAGEVVTLTAVPDPGWQFDRWEGDVSGTQNQVQVTIDQNPTVNAFFTSEDCGTGLCAAGAGGMLPFMIFGMFLMKNQVRKRRLRRVS